MNTRFATKPQASGWSRTTSGFLPQRRARATRASRTASAVPRWTTISATRMTEAGVAQCHPMTRSGRSVAPARGSDREAGGVGGEDRVGRGAASSSRRKRRVLSWKSSYTASMTRSASATASERSVVPESRPKAPSATEGSTFPISTPLPDPEAPVLDALRGPVERLFAEVVHRDLQPAEREHLRDPRPHEPGPDDRRAPDRIDGDVPGPGFLRGRPRLVYANPRQWITHGLPRCRRRGLVGARVGAPAAVGSRRRSPGVGGCHAIPPPGKAVTRAVPPRIPFRPRATLPILSLSPCRRRCAHCHRSEIDETVPGPYRGELDGPRGLRRRPAPRRN